jgi:hypothetical protein
LGVARLTVVLVAVATLLTIGTLPAGAYPGAPWFEPGKPYTQNFPDPNVLRVGDTYYAYATSTGGAYLPVMTSTDLRTWTARPAYNPGPPLNKDPYFNDALPYPASWGADRQVEGRLTKEVRAPGVARIGGRYVLYYTLLQQVSPARYCISVAVSSSPLGPFVDSSSGPIVCDADPVGSIDPEPFVDQDGSAYLLWKSEGLPASAPTRLWSRRLNSDGLSLAGPAVELLHTTAGWEGNVIESPSMVRFDGALVLFYSGNEWASSAYATGYAMCDAPLGPCAKQTVDAPLFASAGDRLGPGGASGFVDGAGRLQVAYHWWNAPYTNYPDYPACRAESSCTTQGQRRMSAATFDRIVQQRPASTTTTGNPSTAAPPGALAVPAVQGTTSNRRSLSAAAPATAATAGTLAPPTTASPSTTAPEATTTSDAPTPSIPTAADAAPTTGPDASAPSARPQAMAPVHGLSRRDHRVVVSAFAAGMITLASIGAAWVRRRRLPHRPL